MVYTQTPWQLSTNLFEESDFWNY